MGPSPHHVLSARIEAAEVAHLGSAVTTYASLCPNEGAEALYVSGGVAGYFGPTISLSRAVGLGMHGPVTAADLDALEAFYDERAMGVSLHVSALADDSLLPLLAARGFVLLHLDSVLVRTLDDSCLATAPGETDDQGSIEIGVRVAEAAEAKTWVRTSLAGFADADAPPPGNERHAAIYEACFTVPSTQYFFASSSGGFAGAGALDIQGRTAQFFAASTLASSRGIGVQSALLRSRLAHARRADCDLAFVRTAAGSTSQRNAERCGFRLAYARAAMSRPARTRAVVPSRS